MYMDEEKRLGVMSIGFFLNNRNDAIIWRGPKKNGCYISFQIEFISMCILYNIFN